MHWVYKATVISSIVKGSCDKMDQVLDLKRGSIEEQLSINSISKSDCDAQRINNIIIYWPSHILVFESICYYLFFFVKLHQMNSKTVKHHKCKDNMFL